MSSQAFTASDIGLTTAIKAAKRDSVPDLLTALRAAITEWDKLATTKRDDGGAIGSKARSAARYASFLVDDHGADREALKTLIADRTILKAKDAEVIAAIMPAESKSA